MSTLQWITAGLLWAVFVVCLSVWIGGRMKRVRKITWGDRE
jgi:hypothetical protein